jgi:hypothetical protein
LECPGISTVNSVQYRNSSAVGTSDAEEGTFDPASANQPLYVNRVLSGLADEAARMFGERGGPHYEDAIYVFGSYFNSKTFNYFRHQDCRNYLRATMKDYNERLEKRVVTLKTLLDLCGQLLGKPSPTFVKSPFNQGLSQWYRYHLSHDLTASILVLASVLMYAKGLNNRPCVNDRPVV